MNTHRLSHSRTHSKIVLSSLCLYVSCLAVLICAPAADVRAGFWDEVGEAIEKGEDAIKKGTGAVKEKVQDGKDAAEDSEETVEGIGQEASGSGQASSGAKQGTATTANSGLACAYPPLASVSTSMLIYKYAPELYMDEEMQKRAAKQIKSDQYYHSDSGIGSPDGYVAVFSQQAVEGRNPEFAAKDLLDEYRTKIADIASGLPARYSVVIGLNVNKEAKYDHGRGVVHKWNDPDYLIRENAKTNVAGIEGRAVYDPAVASTGLSGGAGNVLKRAFGYDVHNHESLTRGMPVTMANNVPPPREYGKYGGVVLALDRLLQLPALPLSSADAERMLTPPQHPGGLASPKLDKFYEEMQQYLGAFLFCLDVEIDDVVLSDGRYVVRADVLGGRLLGPRAEALGTYAAADFASPSEVRAEQLAAAERQHAAQAAEEAERQRAVDEKLAALEVLGVRPGMSVKEAESLLRDAMDVQTVYRFSAPPSPSVVRADGKAVFDPYESGLLLVGDDGHEVVALYDDGAGSLLGLTRRMLSKGLTQAALESALTDKYGKPTTSDGNKWFWGETGKRNVCAGYGALSAASPLKLLEGEPVVNVTYKAAGIGITSYWPTADELAACRTVLQVSASFERTPTVEFRFIDHSAVAPALRAIEEAGAAKAASAENDLKL